MKQPTQPNKETLCPRCGVTIESGYLCPICVSRPTARPAPKRDVIMERIEDNPGYGWGI